MTIENPTIIVPGIVGSSLENFYSIDPSATWSDVDAARLAILGADLDELALDPTARFDASTRVVTRADGVLPIAYASLVNVLRKRRELPVYVFPYDWRYSIEAAGSRLAQFATLVKDKVAAGSPRGWSGRIDFVCHSMGGLVFRAMLRSLGAVDGIGRVALVAVPHRGSLDALEAMVRGQTPLFGGRKEVRKLARTFPGMYELLPRFKNAIVDKKGKELDVFDVRNWQPNVTPHGPDGREKSGFDVEQAHLDAAKQVLGRLLDPVRAGLHADDLLTIYGSYSNSTLVSVEAGPEPDRHYDFGAFARGEGDKVVPARSALLEGVPAVKLTWDDVSYFTETTAALNMHAFILTLDETKTIVSRFLAGENGTDLLPRGLPPSRYENAPAPEP